jgi:NADH-quinone oxidoreductase subunit K
MTIGLNDFLIVSGVIFALGLFTVVTRRNAVAILMGIELMLNAALLNLVAFSQLLKRPLAPGGDFTVDRVGGQVFTLFGIVLAAAEAVVALAIVLQLYRAFRSVDASEAKDMKE